MTATGSTGASDITAPASGTEAFRALGFTFSVQTSDAALAGHIDQLLASLAPYRITLDTQEVAVAPSLGRVLDYLLWHINRQVLEHTDDALLVHAGAVAGRRGAVVLPAPSGSGKSTVVAALVRSGMGYLTDEATAVDPATCTLHPYPKPLSLDQGSLQALADLGSPFLDAEVPEGSEKLHVAPTTVRAGSLATACAPAFVIVPSYIPGARDRIAPLPRARALVLLAQSSFNLAAFGSSGFLALAELVRQSACYRLEFGDLGRACSLVLDLVEQAPVRQPQP